ncbi:hypothetical protein [Clostridium sp.]|uniref:hypothetical protein n=1 Tax=Clostridium sp. TaxID=1506 RepID=UPI0032165742
MQIRLLKKGYKNNEQFYQDFLNDQINSNDEYFSGEEVSISEIPNFPIYMNISEDEERNKSYFEAFGIISKSYLNTDRDIHLDEVFWHSLLCTKKREYLLEKYSSIKDGINVFNNIVLKKFDWENYIYKCILGAQYICDNILESEREKYFQLIIDNLDLYNYIIKYEIFRNDRFLINILDIINDLDLSKVLKAKIKDRDDLGKDERVGRRVIFEFNKSYPVVMSPMLEKDELQQVFLKYLSYYYDINKLNV